MSGSWFGGSRGWWSEEAERTSERPCDPFRVECPRCGTNANGSDPFGVVCIVRSNGAGPDPEGVTAFRTANPKSTTTLKGSQTILCVRGSSDGLPMASRCCGASEEAATKEQTPEPLPHPARQGSHSG